jgi:hypothetical protein
VAGSKPAGSRHRAVGTRDRIMSYLAAAGEIKDEGGMASTVLAKAIGYPGSSIAFAQLLSGMERSGLIQRDVRGKRTYRITAAAGVDVTGGAGVTGGVDMTGGVDVTGGGVDTECGAGVVGVVSGIGMVSGASGVDGVAVASVGANGPRSRPVSEEPASWEPVGRESVSGEPASGESVGGRAVSAGPGADLDYDELARRLLVQVARQLMAAGGTRAAMGLDGGAALRGNVGPTEGGGMTGRVTAEGGLGLERVVGELERELASVRTVHGVLSAENARLREQLRLAHQSLAVAQQHAGQPVAEQLDAAEVGVLERLLSPAAGQAEDTDAC